jgi:Rieske Fe-S protein
VEGENTVGRRQMLAVSAAVVVGGATLAACGDDGGDKSPAASGGGAKALGKTTDIPVGGGKVFGDQGIVVTQPEAGTFKGFSSTCTHQGCTVSRVADGLIECPCHGSAFAIADGAVKAGPAPKPLPAKQITVTGDQILTA